MLFRTVIARAFSLLVCFLILFSPCQPVVLSQAPLPALPGDPDAPGLFQRDRSISVWYTESGGFQIVDLDGDGANEILATGMHSWKVFSYDPSQARYTVDYLSKVYFYNTHRGIDCSALADFGPGAGYRILVAAYENQLEVYDGATRRLVSTAALPHTYSTDSWCKMTARDIDLDSELEIVMLMGSGLRVFDALTYTLEWSLDFSPWNSYVSQPAVGNTDDDPNPEIVVSGRIIDGVTRIVEWQPARGFGAAVQTADIDGDNRDELIALPGQYDLAVYDADTQTTKWTINSPYAGYDTLTVEDIDADGTQEIVTGNDQGGDIRSYDSVTHALEWSIHNPELGTNSIATGDTDGDGQVEVLWGTDADTSADDALLIGDTVSHTIEWRSGTYLSNSASGGYSSVVTGDVDADGQEEIVVSGCHQEDGFNGTPIVIFDARTRQPEWAGPYPSDGNTPVSCQNRYPIRLAMLDADPALEILFSINNRQMNGGDLYAIDGKTHAQEWIWETENWAYPYATIASGDVDLDGQIEVLAGEDQYLNVFDPSANVKEWKSGELYTKHSSSTIDTEITLCNLDSDSYPEIVARSEGLWVFDGKTKSVQWMVDTLMPGEVACADMEGDGQVEVVVGDYYGQVNILDGQTGALKASHALFPLNIYGRAPLIGLLLVDLNHDAQLDIITSDGSAVSAFNGVDYQSLWQSQPLADHYLSSTGDILLKDLGVNGRPELLVGSDWSLTIFRYDPSDSNVPSFASAFSAAQSVVKPGAAVDFQASLNNTSSSTRAFKAVIPLAGGTLEGSPNATLGNVIEQNQSLVWTVTLAPSEAAQLRLALRLSPDLKGGNHVTLSAYFQGDGIMLDQERSTSVNVDDTPPHSVIGSPLHASIFPAGDVLVSGTASDDYGVAKVEIQQDDGAWETAAGTNTWSATLVHPTEGSHQVRIRATDLAGNTETPGGEQSITFSVDVTPPLSAITSPVSASVLPGGQVMVRGVASDTFGVAKVEVQIDSSQWVIASGTSDWTVMFTPPVDGVHRLQVRATDLAGNVEPPGQTVSFVVDSIAPQSAISNPEPFGILSIGNGEIKGTASDNHGLFKVEVQIDDSEWVSATGTSTWVAALPLPADGLHQVRTRATDLAGNIETQGQGRPVYISNHAPVILSVKPVYGSIDVDVNAPIEVQFNIPVLPATIKITCDPPVTLSVPRQGASSLAVVLEHTPFRNETVITCSMESIQSTTGNTSSAPFIWSFTTVDAPTFELYLPAIFR